MTSTYASEADPRFQFPYPNSTIAGQDIELEIYARFMRHLRHVPSSRMEIKILSSIQFTADMMDVGDALVSKILVDMGMRAPRRAFPAAFLEHVDAAILRTGWDAGGPSIAVIELKNHWDKIGEDRFAAFRRHQVMVDRERLVREIVK